ncbi:ATP-binding protein [Kitasatospora camelliae]|uniref:ATP-binding protein n=1 Tax=Kitasatospora camelliae TaxID=3156397 RepID=A0AAU8K5M1_9ACTN
MELPSEVASVHAAEAWTGEVARVCGLGEGDRDRLGLAVHEAVANAVLHGNRQEPGKRVRLAWERQDGRLTVTVGDEGAGFTPPRPTTELNLTPSGRGLLLIDHLTDGFRIVRRHDPPGTDVVLVLHLTEERSRQP